MPERSAVSASERRTASPPALLHPERQVVVVSGDGAFGINAMEIDSAKRHGAKVVFIIANNAAWNIERLDQQMNYGGRVVGTTLAWSDYAAMARAFGLHAERVTDPARLEGRAARRHSRRPRLARRRRDAGCAELGCRQGPRLGARLSGAHRLGRRREGTPEVSGVLNLGEIVAAHARLRRTRSGRATRAVRSRLRSGTRAPAGSPTRCSASVFRRVIASRCSPTTASSGWRSTSRWRRPGWSRCRSTSASSRRDPLHRGALRRASVHRRGRSDRPRRRPSRRPCRFPRAAGSGLGDRARPGLDRLRGA